MRSWFPSDGTSFEAWKAEDGRWYGRVDPDEPQETESIDYYVSPD